MAKKENYNWNAIFHGYLIQNCRKSNEKHVKVVNISTPKSNNDWGYTYVYSYVQQENVHICIYSYVCIKVVEGNFKLEIPSKMKESKSPFYRIIQLFNLYKVYLRKNPTNGCHRFEKFV